MANQVTVYTELLHQINLPPEVTSFLINLFVVFYYFLVVALSLGVGWLTSPLIWPLQAKIFAELKKYDPPQNL